MGVQMPMSAVEGMQILVRVRKKLFTFKNCSCMSFNQRQRYHGQIVDDVEVVRSVMERLLTRKGALVQTACNGCEAIELVK